MSARLDQLLVDRGLFDSREQARRAIMAGTVHVNGQRVDKAGEKVREEVDLAVVGPKEPFVSRAGRKLSGALDHFLAVVPELDPSGRICLDVGASTGGFTDCLLQRGASRVYALDVGYGQLDARLRSDPRVIVMERVNARHLASGDLPERASLVTIDVSFISLLKVVPALIPHLESAGFLLALIKPQFEVGRGRVGKGGIVRDEDMRRATIEQVAARIAALGFERLGVVDCALRGAEGNLEAFGLFRLVETVGRGDEVTS